MKFFIVLIILLVGEPSPKVFVYKYETFLEIETCDLYIKTSKESLKQSIERQFPVETIEQSIVVCMTQQEIDKLYQKKLGV